MEDNVYLDLTLQFQRGDAWANVYDFDRDLSLFLKSLGLEGKVIEPIKGMPGRRFVYVSKMKKDILDDPGQGWRKKEGKK